MYKLTIFTVDASEPGWTLTAVGVDTGHTLTAILTWVYFTFVVL